MGKPRPQATADGPLFAGAAAPAETDRDACECGGTLVFDPTIEGETVGGLRLAGWNRCTGCKEVTVSRRGVPAGAWKLTALGLSIDAGGIRLRADGNDSAAIMARIVRLPTLEAALRAIARGDADPAAIARAALEAA